MAPNGGAIVFVVAFVSASLFLGECSEPLNWVSIEAQGTYILDPSGKGCKAIPNTFAVSADGTWADADEYDLQGNMDDDCAIEIQLTIPIKSDGCGPIAAKNNTITDAEIKEKKCEEMKKNVEQRKEKSIDRRRLVEENKTKLKESITDLNIAKKSFDEKLKKAMNKKKLKENIENMTNTVKKLNETVLKRDGDLKRREGKLELQMKANNATDEKCSLKEEELAENDKKYKKNLKEYETLRSEMDGKLIKMRDLLDNCQEPTDEMSIVAGLGADSKICTHKNEGVNTNLYSEGDTVPLEVSK